MGRTQASKDAQKRYRERNREKINKINSESNKRNYTDEVREAKRIYHFKNRNYRNIESTMGACLCRLFDE